jgi:hypothetical protein
MRIVFYEKSRINFMKDGHSLSKINTSGHTPNFGMNSGQFTSTQFTVIDSANVNIIRLIQLY